MTKSKYEVMLDEMLDGEIFQNTQAESYVINNALEDEKKLIRCTKQELLVILRKSFVVLCIEIDKKNSNLEKLSDSQIDRINLLNENDHKAKKIALIKKAMPVYEELIGSNARSKNSKKAVDKKNKKYEPLKMLAKELVKAKKYKSRRNAAISIKSEILEKSNELGIGMSEMQAEITIIGWLKAMNLPENI